MENSSANQPRKPVCAAPGCWLKSVEVLGRVPLCEGHGKGVRLSLGLRGEAAHLTAIVYYVSTDGGETVKVGTTTNPRSRFGSLLKSAPGEFRVLAARPGSYKEESEAHQQLALHRAGRREYFKLSPAVIAHIHSVQLQWPDWRDLVNQLDIRVSGRRAPNGLLGQLLDN